MILNRIKNKIYRVTEKAATIFGMGVKCNICENKVLKLDSDDWHQFAVCPKCESQIRHRLLMAALNNTNEFNYKTILENKTVLHFAPDLCLRKSFEKMTANYLTADFMAEGYDYENIKFNLDMSNMPTIKDNSIDLIIALDVLEHVPKHLVALSEAYRVLKSGGVCVFTIPQKDGLEKTFEDDKIISSEDRKKHYGQWDHLRIYGSNFAEFMRNAGFQVSIIDENSFSSELVKKHVLFPPVLSSHPLATNYRKVYFGIKK